MFTLAFSKLVYPQIWEDPVVDMKALEIGPDCEVIAIASGGCNVLSYLTADPAGVTAVDLNGAHVALGRLKICALQNLRDYETFFRFFGRADARANVSVYEHRLRAQLDPATRAYWDKRRAFGRRRIGVFARNVYRHGVLGHFLGAGHTLARLHGLDPSVVLKARTIEEQRALYRERLAPIFDKPLVRWLMKQPASLYGLGIPPAQYKALAADSPSGIGDVLSRRLERLACGFDIADNYFAWQAFGRRYAPGPNPSLPPYLKQENFEAVQSRCGRVRYVQRSLTEILRDSPPASFDRYALLDAQDWMNDADLTALWTEITRTARPGARVIFRTAADEPLLPGRLPDKLLGRWTYEEERSREFGRQDRSSIYGAFHLYILRGA
ncbi:MAG: BtaA family protein [Hyphomicrobiales bacterium]|nr:BtaA family protein [Hyphomicrobiales bacterium]MBV8444152.1 BtaA family protein [Hyphomicrobiales bacterium]